MNFNIKEIKKYINENPDAKIIIGGDSQRISKRKKTFRFVTAVVVYQRDKNKIFWEVTKEKSYDQNPGKPILRMLEETKKIVDITLELMDILEYRDFEIHLDISPKVENGSNCALSSAVGYVWGVIGVEPIVKPNAWCSSVVADHIVKTNKKVLNYL